MWPSGWESEALRASGIPTTLPAMTAMAAWCRSTPVESWTNNPLGLRPTTARIPRIPLTEYAIYPTTDVFRQELKKWFLTDKGKPVKEALMLSDSYSAIWRAVNASGLPAVKTEEDYPSALLDLVARSYERALENSPARSRRSSGVPWGKSYDRTVINRYRIRGMQALSDIQSVTRRMG